MNFHECCTKPVLTETGILGFATRIFASQLIEQCFAQHSLALSVDKHNSRTGMLHIGIHHLAELVELIIEHIGIAHSCSSVDKLADVQVALYDFAFALLSALHRLAHRAVDRTLLLHGSPLSTVSMRAGRSLRTMSSASTGESKYSLSWKQ